MFAAESATPKENWTPRESLDSLHYKCFYEKVYTNTSCIHPQTLPHISAAAKYHCLCIYFQLLEWKGSDDGISSLEWGWNKGDGKLMSVLTDLPPAPDELLKMIRCNCHSDCSSMRCSCKKHNMKCSPVCGNCRGSGCTNSNNPIHEDDDDIDDDIE